jgi:nitroreductase
MSGIKIAKTQYSVNEIIKNRWSARSFAQKPIEEEKLLAIFEAASWAPSANNEQPWNYLYATKESSSFEKIWSCLSSGNQPWTKHAYVLAVSLGRKTFSGNGKENHWTAHDVGMANAQLLLQAASMQIYAHPMAGYDKQKLKEVLNLSIDVEPYCVFSLGYLGEAENLDEPYRTRELTARTRKPMEDWLTRLS